MEIHPSPPRESSKPEPDEQQGNNSYSSLYDCISFPNLYVALLIICVHVEASQDPFLYSGRSSSWGPGSTSTKHRCVGLGSLQLKVWYQQSSLHVHVRKAQGLTASKHDGLPNTYVEGCLLPQGIKRETDTRKGENPIYNETLQVLKYLALQHSSKSRVIIDSFCVNSTKWKKTH